MSPHSRAPLLVATRGAGKMRELVPLLAEKGIAAESLAEHAAIVAAIRVHDGDAAEAAARAHIRAAFKARIRIWQES